jgi:hypothetical protein
VSQRHPAVTTTPIRDSGAKNQALIIKKQKRREVLWQHSRHPIQRAAHQLTDRISEARPGIGWFGRVLSHLG